MRNKFFVLLMTVIAVTALLVTACDSGGTELVTKNECKITFSVAGAPAPEDITVARGRSMGDKYPNDPQNENANFLFYGWYDSGIRYERDSVINSDLDLTARWVREQDMVIVTFNTDGGTSVLDLPVLKGEPIGLRIPVSRKKNYTFDGWFSGTTKYTAEGPVVNANITLTAHWTIKPTHTVTFRTYDVNLLDPNSDLCTISPITVYDGEGLESALPTATHTDPKIKFVMWIGEDNELYDEFTPINEDMTFIAKWGLDPYEVKLSEVGIRNNTGASNYDAEYNAETGTIKNKTMYSGGGSRWEIMYRILLNLPDDFNMGYYTRYTLRARFFGNHRAILGNPEYASGYMNDDYAILAVGDEMLPKAGYGQLSWTISPTDNGNPGNAPATVIAQQYNLGTTSTVNQQWAIGGHYTGPIKPGDGKPIPPGADDGACGTRPSVLLIQTSDNWIGWIEITEIVFHNGEEEYTAPPPGTED